MPSTEFKNQPIFQQDLKRCRIRSTPYCTSAVFFFLSMVYGMLLCTRALPHLYTIPVAKRYDDVCAGKVNCQVSIEIPREMKAPVYLYYRLTNFVQNHRDIANSYSKDMLAGKPITDIKKQRSMYEDCYPRAFVDDIEHINNLLVPCGLLPSTIFNDTIVSLNSTEFEETNIALSIDLERNFKETNVLFSNSSNWLEDSGIFPHNTYNEHFIVWMRTSAFTPFRKLYGISKKNIPAGNITFDIVNRYDTNMFNGEKWIVISEKTDFGSNRAGPAIVFAIMTIMFGLASLGLALIGWSRAKPTSPFHPANIKNSFNESNQ